MERDPTSERDDAMLRPKTILIVDPDPCVQDQLHALLSEDGCDVERASRISETISRLRKIRFDCIIMDEDLPDMKGHEAVPIIRAIDARVPIIMTAAINTRDLEAKIREQDIFYYHIKSFDRDELMAAVRNVLRATNGADHTTHRHQRSTPTDPPAAASVARSPTAGPSRQEVTEMQPGTRILIVDDDPDFVDATRRILEGASYKVETALSGDEATEALSKSVPDLIILDIMMQKGADGIMLSRKFKKDDRLARVPILVLTSITEQTGFSFIGEPRHPRFFPIEEFMEKPVPAADLLAKIEQMLKRSQQ
jgi:DNA-binding response OmpR family regulator